MLLLALAGRQATDYLPTDSQALLRVITTAGSDHADRGMAVTTHPAVTGVRSRMVISSRARSTLPDCWASGPTR